MIQTQKYNKIKNSVLLSLALISQLHVIFRESGISVVWLLNDKRRTLNFTVFLACVTIKDVVLTYILWKPKGIDRRLPFFLFVLSILDILHLFFFSFVGFEDLKIGMTLVIFLLIKKFYNV